MSALVASPVAECRRRLGLSQLDLARAAGVSRQAIGSIESGRTQPTVGVALALARTLGTTVERLFAAPLPALDTGDAGPHERVALASIDGRLVARGLRPAGGGGLPAAADALVRRGAIGGERTVPLGDAREVEANVWISGCELAAGILAQRVGADDRARGAWFPSDNRVALADLAARRTHAALVHVPDAPSAIERLARNIVDQASIYSLARIDEGWATRAGEPFRAAHLRSRRRRLANRPRGAAARDLLDRELRAARVERETVDGYARELDGHLAVAAAIANDLADVGIVPESVARLFGLDFVPLRRERCLLVVRRSDRDHRGTAALVRSLGSRAFANELSSLDGYDTTDIAEEIALVD